MIADNTAVHPLTLRERLYLTARLQTVRGRALRDGDRMAVDRATAVVAGVYLDEHDKVQTADTVADDDLASLQAAVAVLERIVRARRRDAAQAPGSPWIARALTYDHRALQLLRRVRNASRRAAAGPGAPAT